MLIRFPLNLPPVAKPRQSFWRAFIGFVVVVLMVLLLIYGVGPAIEGWQEQVASEIQEGRQ